MSKQSRRKSRDRGVDTGEPDPDDIRKAIYHIEAYRSHVFYNLSFVDDMVERGSLGRTFGKDWKKLRRRLIKMARATASNPANLRLARYQSLTEAFWQIAVPIVFVLMIAALIAPGLPFISTIAPYIMVVAFSAMIVGLLGRFILGARIARNIEAYFTENPEAQELRVEDLRTTVQGLINELRRILYSSSEDPEDHLVGIALLDYEYIEVVKKPRPWRQYYLVKVTF
ncbi:MAG: hypothetical protein JSW05_10845 [Candidatus Thorarchaeota archaeon]|nr:MAG: hypothetical protein JSW05_10845 [Candidatus Thorarchaeota archaeon]